ncbi:hypothetical protein K9M47_00685 [Candidatus Gracilibacteria bacterium]|nr:hypothetical protein [Candidatus Gracilibacteria bacterium]MCF7898354.1 hypothetical protein [Candidatus Paceibacterota bacterium]
MKKIKNIAFKVAVVALMSSLSIATVSAGVLSSLSDSMSSVKINALSNHSFSFVTPSGVASGTDIVITFPGAFSIPAGLTFADVDINVGGPYVGSSTLAAAPSGATWGVVRTSANVLTITNGNSVVASSSALYIRIGTNAIHDAVGTFQVTNDSSIGNGGIGITGSFGDTGTTTVNLLSDDNVQVNAIVPQSFTFSISTNSIDFGNLSSLTAKYASSTNVQGDNLDTTAHTLTVSSNSSSGYAITLRGQTLTSQQNAVDTISAIGSSPAVSATGTEQFGIYATKSGGLNGIIAAPYATASSFGFESTATTSSLFASGSTSSDTTVYSLHYLANISSLTEAGSYSAGLIYVGTANF